MQDHFVQVTDGETVGRLTSIERAVLAWDYVTDAVGNPTAILYLLDSSNDQTYGYQGTNVQLGISRFSRFSAR